MLSDMLLDEHDYRYVAQFLNGYKEPAKLYTQGSSAGIDNFKDTAFSSKEQAAIVTEEIDAERETPVFSLERGDLNKQHGFVDMIWNLRCNEWTRAQISHYTRVWLDKNCENNPDKIYYGDWWLNTIAEGTNVYAVSSSGYVSTTDYTDVWGHNKGIRPALWLDLEKTSVWQYAGIVKSADKDRSLTEESMTEIPCKISGGNDRKEQVIRVPDTEVEMTYGESGVSLNAVAAGDLDYYSANASVVEVLENGTLTAVKPGETTVTILAKTTAQYNSTVLEIPVRVVKAEAGLSVAQESMELTVGDDELEWGQIIATTKSNAELQYEALDEAVVSTSYTGGRFLARKQGQTKVRVFQRENEYYNAAEAYIDVKVNRGKSEITGVQSSYTTNRKDKKITISFRKRGNNKIKATVSDSSIAYISRSPYQPKPQYEAYADYQLDVAVRKGGVVTIIITNEENDQYEGSSVSFTLTVVDDNQDDEEPLYDGDEITVENHNYTVLSATKCTLLYSGPTSRNIVSVKIPNVVTVDDIEYKVVGIGDNAFKNCKKLKKVTLPKSITSVGAKAFYKNTSLTQITIPSKVTKIGAQAFYGCKKLKKVTLKTSKLTSKSVGTKAFKGIAGNATVKVPKKKLKTYKKLLKKKGITGKKQKIKS